MDIGEYIKSLRIKHGYSQEQLGKLVGVQRAAVQKWECGRVQNLKRETIQKLSGIFNVAPSSFIDEENAESAHADEELNEYLEELRTRPEMKMLFSLAKGATVEDVKQAVKIIEALRKDDNE